jgi:hypothetical protein
MWQRGGKSPGPSSEQLQFELSLLALERERLRDGGSTRELLETNRLEIGRCQYELSRALIRRHLASTVRRAA